jgi:hypothetical protein
MPDLSFFFALILQSAVIPFAVAFAVLLASRASRLGAAGPALAIAAGFLAAYFAVLHGQWSPLPKVALDWLPWIAVFGTAGAVATERIGSGGLKLAARLALGTAVGALVAWPALENLGLTKALLSAGATGILACVAWSYMARTGVTRPTPPLLLTVVAGGAGIALMLDSSQSIGQLSGAIASVLAARVVFNLPRVRIALSPAAAGAAALLLGALLANAHLYAGFPLGYVALLLGGLIADPLVAGLNRLRQRSGGAGSWVAAAVLTAVPTLLTIGLAAKAAADAGGY